MTSKPMVLALWRNTEKMGGIRLQSNKPAKGSAPQKASMLFTLVILFIVIHAICIWLHVSYMPVMSFHDV